ncbi:hypothetical protein PUNSTDRAFT_111677 [Punctularia strigosozonata HHB-11173 SS5]|uniref:uncharacterized protein n=1 Tax=Punctularia strigosozonata (strain HHB-11173) TaxID=741275 RepID=UPI00044184DB|nr:uncharacterized protein PUNSTDRAFT_111677 [Punctularia strigosozonata HHB-11173 SS5]EIN11569.1 hypothetical protein PUNSTDRAFT_111677 [Punctularia strigosozonata HHB-11173 SS5]
MNSRENRDIRNADSSPVRGSAWNTMKQRHTGVQTASTRDQSYSLTYFRGGTHSVRPCDEIQYIEGILLTPTSNHPSSVV